MRSSVSSSSQVLLQRLKFGWAWAVSEEVLEDLGTLQAPEVERVADRIGGQYVMALRQFLMGQKLEEVHVRVPADWWQAFKLRWLDVPWSPLGQWLCRRWPVRWRTYDWDVKAVYPNLTVLPGERWFAVPTFSAHGEASKPGWWAGRTQPRVELEETDLIVDHAFDYRLIASAWQQQALMAFEPLAHGSRQWDWESLEATYGTSKPCGRCSEPIARHKWL